MVTFLSCSIRNLEHCWWHLCNHRAACCVSENTYATLASPCHCKRLAQLGTPSGSAGGADKQRAAGGASDMLVKMSAAVVLLPLLLAGTGARGAPSRLVLVLLVSVLVLVLASGE